MKKVIVFIFAAALVSTVAFGQQPKKQEAASYSIKKDSKGNVTEVKVTVNPTESGKQKTTSSGGNSPSKEQVKKAIQEAKKEQETKKR